MIDREGDIESGKERQRQKKRDYQVRIRTGTFELH